MICYTTRPLVTRAPHIHADPLLPLRLSVHVVLEGGPNVAVPSIRIVLTQ